MVTSEIFAVAKKLILTLIISISFLLLAGRSAMAQAVPDHFEFSNFTVGGPKIAGIPFQVTITAKDSWGTTIQTFNNTANLTDDTNTIYPNVTSNFQNGVWTGNIYVTRAIASTHVYVNYGSVSGTSAAFSVGPDTRIKFLTIDSGNTQTGTVFTQLAQALVLRVIDPFNNPINAQGMNFAITGYPPGASGQVLANTSVISDVNGRAGTMMTLGRKSGTYVVTGYLTGGYSNNIQFFETANPGPTMSIVISPPLAVVPTGSFIPFTAKGFDQFANEKILANLHWSLINGGGVLDGAGVFYAGDETGNFLNTIKAEDNGAGGVASVSIIKEGAGGGSGVRTATPSSTPRPLIPVINQVIVDPDFIKAMAGATVPITAKALDQFGNVLPTAGSEGAEGEGVSYSFEVSGDLGTLSNQSGGSILLTAFENGIGTVTIRATQGAVTKVAKIVGSVGVGLNRRLVIEPISSPQEVGKPFMIAIAAKDSLNNLVTDYNGPLAIADTTGTIDPAVATPSANGLWYVQGIIGLAHEQVTVTVAGDGMIGVSNIFKVEGNPKKSDLAQMMLSEGVKGASFAAQLQQFMLRVGLGGGKGVAESGMAGIKYIGAGLAAGVGVLGASIGGGIMASRGLEAIGRNPFAKKRLQINLYGSLFAFVTAAILAIAAAFLILR